MPNVNIAVNNDSLSVSPFSTANATTKFPPGEEFVTINGDVVLIQGDDVSTHTNNVPDPPVVHENATMNTSQSFVTINNIPIVIDGDSATCSSSHTINATGFVTITITS